jgi:hypothetical protein
MEFKLFGSVDELIVEFPGLWCRFAAKMYVEVGYMSRPTTVRTG